VRSFSIITPHQHYPSYERKKLGGACSTHWGEARFV